MAQHRGTGMARVNRKANVNEMAHSGIRGQNQEEAEPSLAETVLNDWLASLPRVPMVDMQKSAMSARLMAYSVVVGPSSFRQNSSTHPRNAFITNAPLQSFVRWRPNRRVLRSCAESIDD